MDFNVGFGLFLLAVGLFGVVTAAMNVDSFMSSGKVGVISKFAGRAAARLVVGATGVLTCLGALAVIFARHR
jgi:hypothetical protein